MALMAMHGMVSYGVMWYGVGYINVVCRTLPGIIIVQ
jgi:hypothetical protein